MKMRELTCIRCPLGCQLTAAVAEDGSITVTGNTCPRGAEYARNELTDPRRMVTSTVRVAGRKGEMVSVKTATDIPKDKITACVSVLREIEVIPPIYIGDVILQNVADTGVDIVATKNVM